VEVRRSRRLLATRKVLVKRQIWTNFLASDLVDNQLLGV
jgi:hypothetical protein